MYPLLECPKLVPIRVPSWCQSGLRFGPTAGSLFLLRFGCWSRRQAMACHGRVFNLRFDCVLNRFVYPSRSKLAFWSCVLNSVICVPEPCVSVLRAKGAKVLSTATGYSELFWAIGGRGLILPFLGYTVNGHNPATPPHPLHPPIP